MRILLIEDDELLGSGICKALTREAYTVEWVKDGQEGLSAATHETFDLVILDLGLPTLDGLSLLINLRESKSSVPVLILTARDTLQEKVAGLDAGADDYLVKPFELVELKARIRALCRRACGQNNSVVELGRLKLDTSAMTVWFDDQVIELNRREYALLLEFVNHPGRILTRSHLEDLIYGWEGDVSSNAIEVHIHHLRKKLDSSLIATVRGIGYRFNEN
ncbi:DNA-binding response regulator [Gammaproteobacteria bacterium 45_16_T64]|nr:DNA-binding response regulator [Gammaproteobacteria bacterium 45_16_T64]